MSEGQAGSSVHQGQSAVADLPKPPQNVSGTVWSNLASFFECIRTTIGKLEKNDHQLQIMSSGLQDNWNNFFLEEEESAAESESEGMSKKFVVYAVAFLDAPLVLEPTIVASASEGEGSPKEDVTWALRLPTKEKAMNDTEFMQQLRVAWYLLTVHVENQMVGDGWNKRWVHEVFQAVFHRNEIKEELSLSNQVLLHLSGMTRNTRITNKLHHTDISATACWERFQVRCQLVKSLVLQKFHEKREGVDNCSVPEGDYKKLPPSQVHNKLTCPIVDSIREAMKAAAAEREQAREENEARAELLRAIVMEKEDGVEAGELGGGFAGYLQKKLNEMKGPFDQFFGMREELLGLLKKEYGGDLDMPALSGASEPTTSDFADSMEVEDATIHRVPKVVEHVVKLKTSTGEEKESAVWRIDDLYSDSVGKNMLRLLDPERHVFQETARGKEGGSSMMRVFSTTTGAADFVVGKDDRTAKVYGGETLRSLQDALIVSTLHRVSEIQNQYVEATFRKWEEEKHPLIVEFKKKVTTNNTYTVIDGVPHRPLVQLWPNVVQQLVGLLKDACYGKHSDDAKSVTSPIDQRMDVTGCSPPTACSMQSLTACFQDFEDIRGRPAVNLSFHDKTHGNGETEVPKSVVPLFNNVLHFIGPLLQLSTNHEGSPVDVRKLDIQPFCKDDASGGGIHFPKRGIFSARTSYDPILEKSKYLSSLPFGGDPLLMKKVSDDGNLLRTDRIYKYLNTMDKDSQNMKDFVWKKSDERQQKLPRSGTVAVQRHMLADCLLKICQAGKPMSGNGWNDGLEMCPDNDGNGTSTADLCAGGSGGELGSNKNNGDGEGPDNSFPSLYKTAFRRSTYSSGAHKSISGLEFSGLQLVRTNPTVTYQQPLWEMLSTEIATRELLKRGRYLVVRDKPTPNANREPGQQEQSIEVPKLLVAQGKLLIPGHYYATTHVENLCNVTHSTRGRPPAGRSKNPEEDATLAGIFSQLYRDPGGVLLARSLQLDECERIHAQIENLRAESLDALPDGTSSTELMDKYFNLMVASDFDLPGCGGGQITSGGTTDTPAKSSSSMASIVIPRSQKDTCSVNKEFITVSERGLCMGVFANEKTLGFAGKENTDGYRFYSMNRIPEYRARKGLSVEEVKAFAATIPKKYHRYLEYLLHQHKVFTFSDILSSDLIRLLFDNDWRVEPFYVDRDPNMMLAVEVTREEMKLIRDVIERDSIFDENDLLRMYVATHVPIATSWQESVSASEENGIALELVSQAGTRMLEMADTNVADSSTHDQDDHSNQFTVGNNNSGNNSNGDKDNDKDNDNDNHNDTHTMCLTGGDNNTGNISGDDSDNDNNNNNNNNDNNDNNNDDNNDSDNNNDNNNDNDTNTMGNSLNHNKDGVKKISAGDELDGENVVISPGTKGVAQSNSAVLVAKRIESGVSASAEDFAAALILVSVAVALRYFKFGLTSDKRAQPILWNGTNQKAALPVAMRITPLSCPSEIYDPLSMMLYYGRHSALSFLGDPCVAKLGERQPINWQNDCYSHLPNANAVDRKKYVVESLKETILQATFGRVTGKPTALGEYRRCHPLTKVMDANQNTTAELSTVVYPTRDELFGSLKQFVMKTVDNGNSNFSGKWCIDQFRGEVPGLLRLDPKYIFALIEDLCSSMDKKECVLLSLVSRSDVSIQQLSMIDEGKIWKDSINFMNEHLRKYHKPTSKDSTGLRSNYKFLAQKILSDVTAVWEDPFGRPKSEDVAMGSGSIFGVDSVVRGTATAESEKESTDHQETTDTSTDQQKSSATLEDARMPGRKGRLSREEESGGRKKRRRCRTASPKKGAKTKRGSVVQARRTKCLEQMHTFVTTMHEATELCEVMGWRMKDNGEVVLAMNGQRVGFVVVEHGFCKFWIVSRATFPSRTSALSPQMDKSYVHSVPTVDEVQFPWQVEGSIEKKHADRIFRRKVYRYKRIHDGTTPTNLPLLPHQWPKIILNEGEDYSEVMNESNDSSPEENTERTIPDSFTTETSPNTEQFGDDGPNWWTVYS